MKKPTLRTRATATLAALALLMGAGAGAAQAYSVTGHKFHWAGWGYGCWSAEYRDYAWYEFKRDGWVVTGRVPDRYCGIYR